MFAPTAIQFEPCHQTINMSAAGFTAPLVVALSNGVIKYTFNSKSGSPCFTFYCSGQDISAENSSNLVLYKTHFAKFLTCLQLNFDNVVSQALDCDVVSRSSKCDNDMQQQQQDGDGQMKRQQEEKEEVLDMHIISEWNQTGYVPCRIILKTCIYRGRLKMWVMKQWLKRPEYSDEYNPEQGTVFANVDDLLQQEWLPCKGGFCIEPLKKELKALLEFHQKCVASKTTPAQTRKRGATRAVEQQGRKKPKTVASAAASAADVVDKAESQVPEDKAEEEVEVEQVQEEEEEEEEEEEGEMQVLAVQEVYSQQEEEEEEEEN